MAATRISTVATHQPDSTKAWFPMAEVGRNRPEYGDAKVMPRQFDGHSTAMYGKGDVVYSQGDVADAVFYIKTGKVKVSVVSEQGKEAVIAVLNKEDFVGQECIAGQTLRTATVSAMADCTIVRMDKAATLSAISVRTFFSRFIRKWVAPIQALMVPNGCSTVSRRRRIA